MNDPRDQRVLQAKGELKDLVLIVRNMQEAITGLKAAGADDSVIRIVMALMGSGNVRSEELVAASTPGEIARILCLLSKRSQN